MALDRLKKALANDETAIIEKFFKIWNASTMRDWRPAFATFKDKIQGDLEFPEWPERLRDRSGLAHYNCEDRPIPIALMEYSVAEVKDAANACSCAAFTAPTVLDSKPSPYFFPTPRDIDCGRSMALYEVQRDEDLLEEIVHFRIEYKSKHILRLDEIRTPLNVIDLRNLRNRHLYALHLKVGREDYGEEITI